MTTRQKRYQYWSKDGIVWSNWFDHVGAEEPIQMKGSKKKFTLLNEYRDKPSEPDTQINPKGIGE